MASAPACAPAPAVAFSPLAAARAAPNWLADPLAVLPRARRLRNSAEFSAVFQARVRAASPSVVVHVARSASTPPGATRVGFVVSKQVGNAVHRNRVKRRLRHMVPPSPAPFAADVVVRALPPASSEPERLAEDFASAWRRAFAKAARC